MIGKNYGKEYVPAFAARLSEQVEERAGSARSGAPDQRRAARPTEVAKYVDRDQARLYELIWNRAVASQMESAELERTTVDIVAKNGAPHHRPARHRPGGEIRRLPDALSGRPGRDAGRRRVAAACRRCRKARRLAKQAIEAAQHFTEPPPRFSEAALVKRMEELGIGRPSTYASILQVLQDRGYVRIDKKRLIPEDKGRVVVGFLESFFQRYVEYDFTASLEEKLDRISNNEIDWKKVLAGFLGRLHRRGQRDQGTAHHAGARRAQRSARAAYFPGARRRRRRCGNARNAATASCR